MTSVPIECRLFATLPLDSTSELLPWAQSLSMAACRQSIALARVSDPEQFRPMIARLEQAMEPSIAMYRDAMARGPTQIKMNDLALESVEPDTQMKDGVSKVAHMLAAVCRPRVEKQVAA